MKIFKDFILLTEEERINLGSLTNTEPPNLINLDYIIKLILPYMDSKVFKWHIYPKECFIIKSNDRQTNSPMCYQSDNMISNLYNLLLDFLDEYVSTEQIK